ncbi:MAG: aminomuconate-semialdehyde/2-hydroxymuconate-6-semialdehyde dehydrogenase, partial [Pseudonocardiales bacterium]|nr:aminomuconate-semialdehyde/2-hydroxymuconate-6-semialdehyde dehydrogenase [Pseudonocardiales bacterium]
HFIDGQWVDSVDGATFESITPIDNTVIATVARGGVADADRAVEAARRAFDDGPWPRMSPTARKQILHRAAALLEERLEEFAQAETLDMGKPIAESRTKDVPRAAYNLRFFADFAEHAHTETYAKPWDNVMTYTLREPAGVAACISPWNFPLMLATWKISPALAYGNTIILKPAEQSPLTAALLAQAFADAGMPDGVVNVVQGFGPDEVGERLTEHAGVDLITFTGESATGRAIMGKAAQTLKRCSFELGGKSAAIVMADADLDRAVAGTIDGIFRNQGEVCLAGSRLFVQRGIYDEFCERYVAAAEVLVVGDPRDPATQVGPLVSTEHFDKVMSYIQLGHREGAKLLTGGERVTTGELASGNYVAPTVFADVDNSWRIAREEIFGPVQVIAPFDNVDEAIALANDSRYGLAGQIWTSNLDTAHKVARGVRTGTMWVNCFFIRDLRAPFGGMKDSGVGREGGLHSEEFFTEAKAVVIQFPS